jgi:ribosomal protein L3 glutamine methyltransferase
MTELVTIRDVLRFAVTQFGKNKIAHGHGTTSAIDEAAFLILETLHLPVDDINPWLDARLTGDERKQILDLIDQRIKTRKPAAYLLKKTYMHGVPFYVDERVIVPRSYIGELLVKGDVAQFIDNPEAVTSILDLCTGSGCLAILASMAFPHASVDATELSPKALEVAEINVGDHDMKEKVSLMQGDLFAPVKKRRYDLIIANPPYVAKAEVDAFPPEYAAEPQMAHLGGTDGLDLVRKILTEAPAHLTDNGVLVCEIGTGQDIIDAEFTDLGLTWLDTENSVGEVLLLKRQRH